MFTPRATEAAQRLGIDLSTTTIANGTARVRISFTEAVKHGDLQAIRSPLEASGAKRIILETGPVVEPSITTRIQAAIKKGDTYLGGRPVQVREVGPSIIPGDPPICEFEIHF